MILSKYDSQHSHPRRVQPLLDVACSCGMPAHKHKGALLSLKAGCMKGTYQEVGIAAVLRRKHAQHA